MKNILLKISNIIDKIEVVASKYDIRTYEGEPTTRIINPDLALEEADEMNNLIELYPNMEETELINRLKRQKQIEKLTKLYPHLTEHQINKHLI